MMWDWHGGDGWGVTWMGLMMVLVWVPILLILVWALREFGRPAQGRDEPPPSSRPSAEPDALEIARRAYARGEIDRERYLQIMEDLGEGAERSGARGERR